MLCSDAGKPEEKWEHKIENKFITETFTDTPQYKVVFCQNSILLQELLLANNSGMSRALQPFSCNSENALNLVIRKISLNVDENTYNQAWKTLKYRICAIDKLQDLDNMISKF